MAEETTSPAVWVKTLSTRLIERRRQHIHDPPLPFSQQFQSGNTLSTGLWNGVLMFEKDKCYVRAVLALVQLLEVGFTPHRRGKYWDRLRIDLTHIYRLHKIDELASLVDKVRGESFNFNWLVTVLAHTISRSQSNRCLTQLPT